MLGLDRHQSEILCSEPAWLSESSTTFCPNAWTVARLSSLGMVTTDTAAAAAAATPVAANEQLQASHSESSLSLSALMDGAVGRVGVMDCGGASTYSDDLPPTP